MNLSSHSNHISANRWKCPLGIGQLFVKSQHHECDGNCKLIHGKIQKQKNSTTKPLITRDTTQILIEKLGKTTVVKKAPPIVKKNPRLQSPTPHKFEWQFIEIIKMILNDPCSRAREYLDPLLHIEGLHIYGYWGIAAIHL